MMKKCARLWPVPLLLAAVSLGGQRLARACWDSLVHFRAPQFTVELGPGAEPVARVVLVVVDGLRVDAFDRMDYVSSLKRKRAFYVLRTGQPSLTLPPSAVIATGAWQDVTGVTTNWFEGPPRQDSLFSLAKDNGLTAAIAFLIIFQVDAFILYSGPILSWYIPDMMLAFKYYLDLMSLIAVGFVSLIVPPLVLGAHRGLRGTSRRFQ